MHPDSSASVLAGVIDLLRRHYVFPDVARELAAKLADGRYPDLGDLPGLAAAVTADLQSVNGDKHLRLLYHADALPAGHGEDDVEMEQLRRWADSCCGGVARAERLPGNVSHLDLRPLLFPTPVAGDLVAAAATLLATTDALLVDLRGCLGGEPGMVAMIMSYLVDEQLELTGTYERDSDRVRQLWTLPYVPGRRFGGAKPVFALTSATTFSGGEALAWDLRHRRKAVVVGETTRGGAHPRRGFRVHDHLEATIPVARAVDPQTGDNWEGTGVAPDVAVAAAEARDTAYRMALQQLPRTPEVSQALDTLA
jgi:peptidase S41-like protein